MKLVVAESWQTFEWYCKSQGIDARDRLRAIPLITYSDKYRLNRRVCRGAKIVRVGSIDPKVWKTFVHELNKHGIEVK